MPIGRWVFQKACRQTRAWQDLLGRADLSISVNLSARQFQHPALQSDILRRWRRPGSIPTAWWSRSPRASSCCTRRAPWPPSRRCGRPGRAGGRGRLRDRVLLARLPPALSRRHPQARPHLRGARRRQRRRGGPGRRDHRARRGRSGCASLPRASRSSRSSTRCSPWAAARAGLPLRQAARRRRHRRACSIARPRPWDQHWARSRTIGSLRPKRTGEGMPDVDRARLSALLEAEEVTFRATHPGSMALHERAPPLAAGRRAHELDGALGRSRARLRAGGVRRAFRGRGRPRVRGPLPG